MHLGIADHFGWAVAVTATADGHVVDRRRIELIEPGVPSAPLHQDSKRLDVAATTGLVTKVRESIARAAAASFDELDTALSEPIRSISLRAIPRDFPQDIEVQMRAPWEARADAVMYRQVMSAVAGARGWQVHHYDAKSVVARAVELLGDEADELLQGPRARLGPPWTKDHRVALAAIVVSSDRAGDRQSSGGAAPARPHPRGR